MFHRIFAGVTTAWLALRGGQTDQGGRDVDYAEAADTALLQDGCIAGVDEAGRGPLAGPVVAAAVVLPPALIPSLAPHIDDSKKLSRKQRSEAFAMLQASGAQIGVGAASVQEIATLNILHASMRAMVRAVERLPAVPSLVLVDGNFPPPLTCPVRCIVGGDATCVSIAAASIVAKVVRDRIMERLARRLPDYGWEQNAGYATQAHRAALTRHGISRHHRLSFGLVAQLAAQLILQQDEALRVRSGQGATGIVADVGR